ncbi:MAG: TonB-dependent receptor plug domain-containing protein [Bacteroidales bacterium]|nr:TonB-dependent receptor plug domain-containing protein [Bacteroidales bacterium]
MNTIKRMIRNAGTIVLALILLGSTAYAQKKANTQQMTRKDCVEAVSKAFNVKFVYDAGISLDDIYTGMSLGRVTDKRPGAEAISLEQCLDRLFENSGIVWSRKGKHIVLKKGNSRPVYREAPAQEISIIYAGGDYDHDADTLSASSVSTDRMRMANRTQTGLTKLDASKINSGFAIFNSPDVIKTIQRLPGVSSGTELLSGLYVHGGTGSDNLYLLDGVPLYSTSHLVGLFSSFNSDVVEDVDFYKSGFPARYGGRLSSVVDVNTREGNMYEWHGNFSIGLIDGRFQIDGPIVKGKTSLNFGLRRTWLDVLTVPGLMVANKYARKEGEKYFGHYAFWDMNLGITHILSDKDKLQFTFFNGMDNLRGGYESYLSTHYDESTHTHTFDYSKREDNFDVGLGWGSTTAGVTWSHLFSDELTMRTRLSYARSDNRTKFSVSEWDWSNKDVQPIVLEEGAYSKEDNRSKVHDMILRSDFDWTPSDVHHLRFGASFQHHIYNPDRMAHYWVESPDTTIALVDTKTAQKYTGEEAALYIEDEISIGDKLIIAPGLRYSIFNVGKKTYHSPEPRLAMRYDVGRNVALKFSYTDMRQYVHLIQTLYLDLPTSSWLPCTENMKPMHSSQIAGGVYARLPHDLHLEVEGFWKSLDHIYEYNGPFTLYPPIEKWESSFSEGRGRAYGAEVAFGWTKENTDINLSYTLSWSKRNFPDFFHTWYYDRNDYRNMLNVTATHRFSNRFELYGGFTYRTGSRLTLEDQGIDPSRDQYDMDNHQYRDEYSYIKIFTSPNNLRMPSYHRLDLGMNFKKLTRRGNERTWNFSVYNAYCHLNPIYAEVGRDEEGNYKGRAYGAIPIIPTFSYQLKF